MVRWLFGAALALGGCQNDDGGRTSFEVGTDPTVASMTASDSDTDPSTGSGNDTDNPSGDETDDPTNPMTEGPGSDTETDSGQGTDDPGTTTGDLDVVPCVGIDVLFVVDNSSGMVEEQARLVATANAFLNNLAPAVPTAMGDINVGVITTDDGELVVPIDAMTMLPTVYSSGQNYMTHATLMLMPEELNIALTRGEGGHPNERPMDFLIEALTGDAATGFNAGFLREDALLVIVLLTDEEDDLEQPTEYGSAGGPVAWRNGVAAVKGGIRRDIAVLSIIPAGGGACTDDADAARLAEFTTSFPHGAVTNVCEPDYSVFLIGQVMDLADACANFSPP